MDIVYYCWLFNAQRLELSDTMHGTPMQTGRPNGVRSSDWLDLFLAFIGMWFAKNEYPKNASKKYTKSWSKKKFTLK
jgi:hypothetical protein